MTFRGPGTIGINDIAVGVRDTYVFITAHDKRRLVEKVDFISHPGKKVCRENEFYGGGPKWIVTPKCIFDFDPDTLEARLAQVFPGVTVDDVKANTGFEVKTAKKVETVPPPSKRSSKRCATWSTRPACCGTEHDPEGPIRHRQGNWNRFSEGACTATTNRQDGA